MHISLVRLVLRAFTGALMLAWSLQGPSAKAQTAGAAADLKDARGRIVGRATLTDTPNGVLIHLTLTNGPTGAHAFHIHEVGACELPGFTSAGGHFNPTKARHGLLTKGGPHAGDLPNIHVPSSGKLEVEVLAGGTAFATGPNAILDSDGAALVIHAAGDDYKTDPAGAAGDRVACGVIEK